MTGTNPRLISTEINERVEEVERARLKTRVVHPRGTALRNDVENEQGVYGDKEAAAKNGARTLQTEQKKYRRLYKYEKPGRKW